MENRRRYEAAVELQLEDEYQQYKKRRGAREEAARKRARLESGEKVESDAEESGEDVPAVPEPEFEAS